MKVTVNKYLNVRSGSPFIMDNNCVSFYQPGDELDISKMVSGQAIDGNNVWYLIANTNYYAWSGGCLDLIGLPLPLAPTVNLTSWGEMVQTAYMMYEKKPPSLQPTINDCDFPDGWTLDSWLTAEPNAKTPKYVANEFFGFIAKNAVTSTLVFVFRGTESFKDWITDVEVKAENDADIGGKVECGFDETIRAMKVIGTDNSVMNFSDKVKSLNKTIDCVVTGHSLGASLATIAASMMAAAGITKTSVYLYASPKTGNPEFVQNFNRLIPNCYAVENIPDLVPKVPPTIPPFINYGDVGQLYKIDSCADKTIKEDILCYHSILTYLYLLGSKKFPLENKCKVTP